MLRIFTLEIHLRAQTRNQLGEIRRFCVKSESEVGEGKSGEVLRVRQRE